MTIALLRERVHEEMSSCIYFQTIKQPSIDIFSFVLLYIMTTVKSCSLFCTVSTVKSHTSHTSQWVRGTEVRNPAYSGSFQSNWGCFYQEIHYIEQLSIYKRRIPSKALMSRKEEMVVVTQKSLSRWRWRGAMGDELPRTDKTLVPRRTDIISIERIMV